MLPGMSMGESIGYLFHGPSDLRRGAFEKGRPAWRETGACALGDCPAGGAALDLARER
jgi:hypothetical protein